MAALSEMISGYQLFGGYLNGSQSPDDGGEVEAAAKDPSPVVSNQEIAISWLGVLIVLIAIRVLYEMAS